GGRRSGAVPWVLDGGGAGVLTDVERPDALAEAILDLWRDPERWARLAQAGWRRARGVFSLDPATARHQEAYQRVLEGSFDRMA
ncbi:MAG: hypothetical protein HQL51_09535, partial [Magnetococcales bacterium]|nr:hypothetical protein [Magnetococcales bacterium]